MTVDERLLTGRRAGQVACPFCDEPIVVSVTALLSGEPMVCGRCGAALAVDRARSATVLDQLKRFQTESAAPARVARPAVESDIARAVTGRRRVRPRRSRASRRRR
jgi:hypothetical protein